MSAINHAGALQSVSCFSISLPLALLSPFVLSFRRTLACRVKSTFSQTDSFAPRRRDSISPVFSFGAERNDFRRETIFSTRLPFGFSPRPFPPLCAKVNAAPAITYYSCDTQPAGAFGTFILSRITGCEQNFFKHRFRDVAAPRESRLAREIQATHHTDAQ